MNIQTLPQRLTFSPMEFAVITGLSISTVHRRLAAGEIKFTRSGRRVLIPRSEIEHLCGHTPEQTQDANDATNNAREAIALLGNGDVDGCKAWLEQIAEKQGPAAALRCFIDVARTIVPPLKPRVIGRRVKGHAKAPQPTKAP